MMSDTRVIIVMGVSGAGKTTVGQALAAQLGWLFIEGDEFHPAANVAAMSAGRPLTDADREPWLRALRARIEEIIAAGQHAVLACSALRHGYRRILAGGGDGAVRFVHLEVPLEILKERVAHRTGHYMPASLLGTQLATLEESQTAVRVDGSRPVPEVVQAIVKALGLQAHGRVE